MTRRKKIISWIFILFTLLGATALYLFLTKQPAPLNETSLAREALSLAKSSKADIYASESFKKAECLYDSAMNCWKRENQKPFYQKRDYSKVKEFAAESVVKANEANAAALKKVNNFQVDLKSKINLSKNMIERYDPIFRKVPMPKNVREENNKGQLLLKEAELAYMNKQFVACNQKATDAEHLLNKSYQYFKNHLEQYFGNYNEWKRTVDETINKSRSTKSTAVVVDKFARKCYLYQAGKLKHQFTVELGPNWIGDKNYKGDKKTPEGLYRVTAVKNSKQTKFYKALLINYPNVEDQIRFKANKNNLPRFAKIGNLIEIHGNGGKQGDWTDGCIALVDSDIDTLFRYASVNMPVAIVGSLRPLHEILN